MVPCCSARFVHLQSGAPLAVCRQVYRAFWGSGAAQPTADQLWLELNLMLLWRSWMCKQYQCIVAACCASQCTALLSAIPCMLFSMGMRANCLVGKPCCFEVLLHAVCREQLSLFAPCGSHYCSVLLMSIARSSMQQHLWHHIHLTSLIVGDATAFHYCRTLLRASVTIHLASMGIVIVGTSVACSMGKGSQ